MIIIPILLWGGFLWLIMNFEGKNHLGVVIFALFNVVALSACIYYSLFAFMHLLRCDLDYFLKRETQEDFVVIRREAGGYVSSDRNLFLNYYIAKTSKGKKRLFKINNDRIVWDQENSVKTKRNIGGKTVYVPKEPRIEIGKTYRVTYYPISKLVVRAEEVK